MQQPENEQNDNGEGAEALGLALAKPIKSERGNKRPLENSRNHTVIHVCVAVGFPSLIFSFRLELTRSPLHEAVAHGHAHVTERLLEVSKNNFHRYA